MAGGGRCLLTYNGECFFTNIALCNLALYSATGTPGVLGSPKAKAQVQWTITTSVTQQANEKRIGFLG
jgi:hypothetical protein